MGRIVWFVSLIVNVLFSTIQLQAQTHRLSYRFTTANSALASNRIYKIITDNDGNIWLGTEKGLIKFDGTNFKTFDTHKGMIDDDVVNLYNPANTNTLWALTFNSKLSRINTRTEKLSNINPKERVLGAYMYAYQNADTINFLNSLQIISFNKDKFSIRSIKKTDYPNFFFIQDVPTNKLNEKLFNEVSWKDLEHQFFPDKKRWLRNTTRIGKYGTAIFNNQIIFKKKDKFYQLLNIEKLIAGKDKFIVDWDIYGNDLYLAVFGKEGGIYYAKDFFKSPTTATLALVSEKGYGVSVLKDKVGNLWYSLQGKGLNFIGVSQLNVNVSELPSANNELYTNIKASNDSLVIVSNPNSQNYVFVNQPAGIATLHKKTSNPAFIKKYGPSVALLNQNKTLIKDLSKNGRMYFSNSIIFYSADFKTQEEYLAENNGARIRGLRKGDYYNDLVLFQTLLTS
ncbi:MAG: hypothetical protein EOO42_04635, partial [Flavobacteriales bacterium]